MTEIVQIIQNASPVLAAAIIGLMFSQRQMSKELKTVEKRIDDYDKLHIEATLAQINTNLEFIKTQIAELTHR